MSGGVFCPPLVTLFMYMCIEEKDFKRLIDRLDGAEIRQREILGRLDGVEERQKIVIRQLSLLDADGIAEKVHLLDNLNGENYRSLTQTVSELNKIVHGDERLGIPPLRTQVREIYTFYDRARWALGVLGITNIGFIIAFLLHSFSLT